MGSKEKKMKKMNLFISLLFFIIVFTDCTKQTTVKDKSIANNSIKTESTEKEKIEEQEVENKTQLLPDFDKNNMESSFKSFYPELDLLEYLSCNFSKDYDEEYIVFYNDPSYITSYSAPLGIDKIIIIFIKKDNLIKLNELKFATMGYNERDLKIILKDSEKYGKWNSYCYLADIDDDGLDELYLYGISGISFDLYIYKYINDEFVMLEYIDYMGK